MLVFKANSHYPRESGTWIRLGPLTLAILGLILIVRKPSLAKTNSDRPTVAREDKMDEFIIRFATLKMAVI